MPEVSLCIDSIKIYLQVVFGYCSGYIPCRSFQEKDAANNPIPHTIWVETDGNVIDNIMPSAKWADKEQAAFYVIPGTVAERGQAKSVDILQMQTVLVDIDTGNTEEKLQILIKHLLDPTLIIESGGITAEGFKKLHAYWQLSEPAEGAELQKLLNLRYHIALCIGGDTHFKSAHQPIRVAGSIYHKGGVRRLVTIRSYTKQEYNLDDLIELAESLTQLESAPASSDADFFNFNNIPPTIEEILTTKVYEGGDGDKTRFSHIQKVVGHWLKCYHSGYISHEDAWKNITEHNAACVIPSFDDDRLKNITNGLWKVHVGKYGEPQLTIQENSNLDSIDPILSWQGTPPQREWIIEGWLPRGYVTALYGDGGVGKSLLAQQLMTCLATGKPFLNIKSGVCRIYALMCEDDSDELWRRQENINRYYNLTMPELSNIRFVSRVGENNLLITFDNSNVGNLTEFFDRLFKDIKEFAPDLVVLDTAADLFAGNENNRTQVRQFVQNACGRIARSIKGAVLLCAHPSESGMQRGTGSGGSTAWNNTVRSRWYLKKAEGAQFTSHHRILSRVKSNYASTGEENYLEWNNGVLQYLNPLSLSHRITGQTHGEKLDAERDRKTEIILHLIDAEALEGRIYTMNQFAESFEGSRHELGSNRSIRDRISVAATKGLIKFFKEPKKYGMDVKSSGYGYLCRITTRLKVGEIIDTQTGEVLPELVRVLPSHYKFNANGSLMPVENPETWVMPTPDHTQNDEVEND